MEVYMEVVRGHELRELLIIHIKVVEIVMPSNHSSSELIGFVLGVVLLHGCVP